jgi:hypothetical protein
MDEKQRAARWADMHERRLEMLKEIEAAQDELDQVEEAMEELFWEMGSYGRQRAYALADI